MNQSFIETLDSEFKAIWNSDLQDEQKSAQIANLINRKYLEKLPEWDVAASGDEESVPEFDEFITFLENIRDDRTYRLIQKDIQEMIETFTET